MNKPDFYLFNRRGYLLKYSTVAIIFFPYVKCFSIKDKLSSKGMTYHDLHNSAPISLIDSSPLSAAKYLVCHPFPCEHDCVSLLSCAAADA